MAETINIAEIAGEISEKLFSRFHWQLAGIFDANFPCENNDHAEKTHPYDCVFYYDDPREKKKVYLLTDLKSYSKETIKSSKIGALVRNLSKAVACAKLSEPWQSEVLVSQGEPWVVHGLLFLYNHDKHFDESLSERLEAIANTENDLPETSRIFILSPRDINFIEMIQGDLQRAATQLKIGDDNLFKFFYPNKLLKPVPETSLERLPIELVMAPFLVITYDAPTIKGGQVKGYIVYYKGHGNSIEEFQYLLNYLLRQRLLSSDHAIEIRSPYLDSSADVNLSKACDVIIAQYHDIPAFRDRLEAVTLKRIPASTERFSEKKIGLERRKLKSPKAK